MSSGPHRALALTARVSFTESLIRGVAGVVKSCVDGARLLATQTAEPALYQRRRDLVLDFPRSIAPWQNAIEQRMREALHALRLGREVARQLSSTPSLDADGGFTLVEDGRIERELVAVRLGQAISDLTGSEYTDLNARLQSVQGAVEPASNTIDVLSPSWLGQVVLDAWLQAGLNLTHWTTLQTVLQHEVAQWAQEGYHHANRLLLDQGLRPEIDLRPFIRRTPDTGVVRGGALSQVGELGGLSGSGSGTGGASGASGGFGGSASGAGVGPMSGAGGLGGQGGGRQGAAAAPMPGQRNSGLQPFGPAYEETHMITQTPGLARTAGQSQAVLGKLNQVVGRQVPGFAPTMPVPNLGEPPRVSPGLGQAMRAADQVVRRHADPDLGLPTGSPSALLHDLQESKRALKLAASTPVERATIEIVALLFQHILMEERLPASIRVWFARLQMPVLRVAVSEPDFFATINHPARMLIDRMGACVMGFAGDAAEQSEDDLHKEIKRIVQVVEAYPDTGRRVFQTVMVEFERFLETYFRDQNEASRKGVSLAQQVEQRETWAIQYTIELRKMLDGVPVHEGVREFLFRVWADVLAHSAVLTTPASNETKALKRAAADLIWSASAKTSREERADVLRRLPPLLKLVRDGMARAGLSVAKQDEHVQALNAALAAAFSARSAAISSAHLKEVTERLESLDEILPDLANIDLDEQTLRDLSGHESDNLEVVAEGGTMPTPAMVSWARELQIGTWFRLEYRHKQEPVQLAWHGLQKQLALFVTPSGRGVLFQLRRLAAFLQAGLLVPVEEESLTTRATREALAKLDADPGRLLS
jgi:hypothetical protein